MTRPRAPAEIFGLSFLDVIACGFGAVVLLLLISRPAPLTDSSDERQPTLPTQEFRATQDRVARLRAELQALLAAQEPEAPGQSGLAAALTVAEQRLKTLERDNRGLELVQESLERASLRVRAQVTERVPEVGGIPVDSEYVIFIVDTSGSMKSIWSQVMDVMNKVLDIHPRVRGFQVLNDNGDYLIKGYKGRWIPDTPQRRRNILNLARNWSAFSNSSPVEGLEKALRTYGKKPGAIAIYIFGDDYTGSSYDQVIATLRRLNVERVTQKRKVRVHAVGFVSQASTERYATLMREATRRNEGAFLALPLKDAYGNTGVSKPNYKTGTLRR